MCSLVYVIHRYSISPSVEKNVVVLFLFGFYIQAVKKEVGEGEKTWEETNVQPSVNQHLSVKKQPSVKSPVRFNRR